MITPGSKKNFFFGLSIRAQILMLDIEKHVSFLFLAFKICLCQKPFSNSCDYFPVQSLAFAQTLIYSLLHLLRASTTIIVWCSEFTGMPANTVVMSFDLNFNSRHLRPIFHQCHVCLLVEQVSYCFHRDSAISTSITYLPIKYL